MRINHTIFRAIVVFVGVGVLLAGLTRTSADSVLWDDGLVTHINLVEQTSEWHDFYQPGCVVETINVYIVGDGIEACIVKGQALSLAVFVDPDGVDSKRYAVKRQTDDKYYGLDVSNVLQASLYGDDIILQNSMRESDKWLYVFNNASEDLQLLEGAQRYTTYELPFAKADYVASTARTRSQAASPNGRYVVLELFAGGLFRIDTQTHSSRLIDAQVANRVYDDRQVVKLAISNDGKYIAVGGKNAVANHLYRVDNCGDEQLADSHDLYQPPSNRCPVVDLSDQLVGVAAEDIRGFTFDANDSRQLNVYTSLRLDYLALGDSYSSGEGDIGKKADGTNFYLPGTDTDSENCHISERSYPYILRDAWGIERPKMKSVACSGAEVVKDYTSSLAGYIGQGGRLAGRDVSQLQKEALTNFIPGRVPQLEFVKKYQPKIVTLTGGGNDVGFVDILSYCASPVTFHVVADVNIPYNSDTCTVAIKDSEANKTLYETIDQQYTYNLSTIRKIQEYSPATQIVIVGYPKFVSNSSLGPCLNGGFLNDKERDEINNLVEYMNQMLLKVANETGVAFADIEDSLVGGRVCEGAKFVNGVYKSNAFNVIFRDKRDPLFHPNADGHKKIAQAIVNGNVLSSHFVNGESTYVVRPSSSISLQEEMVDGSVTYKATGSMDLRTDVHTFDDGSLITVVAYSNPKSLGTFKASPEGALETTVSTADLPVGRHMLIVSGVNEGKQVKLYQFITVRASAADADGDGIPDDKDVCNFIDQWIDVQTGKNVCLLQGLDVQNSANNENLLKDDQTHNQGVDMIDDTLLASMFQTNPTASSSSGMFSPNPISSNKLPLSQSAGHLPMAFLAVIALIVLVVGFCIIILKKVFS